MDNFNQMQEEYNKILKLIEQKKKELIHLKAEEQKWANKLDEERLNKSILSKNDVEKLFINSCNFNFVISKPYYNECLNDGFNIRISIGFSYKYFLLDENNKIIETEEKDKLSQSLIGKYIDLKSYEGCEIKGNYKYTVGIIENGKFKITE